MRRRYFFRHKVNQDRHDAQSGECCVQIPSSADIEQMHQMPAGSVEDQYQRLTHMTQVIKGMQLEHSDLPLIDTNEVNLGGYWYQLFTLINEGKAEAALDFLGQIPQNDPILQALLAVHTREYLQEILINCIKAQRQGWQQLNPDVLLTPKIFEVLIKDIATTLYHAKKIHFSFGLPSHHAFSAEGSGFCIVNKTALLVKYTHSTCSVPVKSIIVGTDVNRDNGLSDLLIGMASKMDICHIDIFDSRVYPWQDSIFINEVFGQTGDEVEQNIHLWKHGGLGYYAVDLAKTRRSPGSVHPALVFALEKVKQEIETAKINGHRVALFLPTGWDSHEKETAECGKWVDGKRMSSEEAKKTRFNNHDLSYFYESFFTIYQENKEHIERVYWGLEGGYDRRMYEQQVQWLMSFILQHLVNDNTNEREPKSPTLPYY